jgi:hypothetical protein
VARQSRKGRPQPAIASAIVTSAKVKEQTGSAIVEPKRRPSNAMLTHLPEDITDAERNRRADMAEEMFREIKRRAGNNG